MPDINRPAYLPTVDVTFEAFRAELVNTPIGLADLGALYAALATARHPDGRLLSVAFSLAMNFTENQYATAVDSIEHRYQTRNWGMRRSLANPLLQGKGIATPRGDFIQYATWLDGVLDYIYSLTNPEGVYQKEHRETVWQINNRWSPAGDQDNDPERKARNVATIMDRLSKPQAGGTTTMTPVVALSAGHHNAQSGNAFEIEQTGNLTRAIGEALKALGITVVHLTPDSGMGMSPLGLDDVAAKVATMNPLPAVYLEPHTEGGGGTGVFAIYPDWGNDVDTDVRDKLGPDIVKRVSAATGLGLGGHDRTGVMSEKGTGVGGDGFRLGIFRVTESVSTTVTRLIVEYGAHDLEPDTTLVRRPDFYAKAAGATAAAIASFLGVSASTVPPIVPGADPVSAALVSWFRAKDPQLQGNLGNSTFYEVNIDWSGIYPQLPKAARGIRGEYFAGWYNPATAKVEPIHLDNFATLRNTGKISPRK